MNIHVKASWKNVKDSGVLNFFGILLILFMGVVLLIAIWPVKAHACSDYEDCMKPVEQKCAEINETETGRNGCIENSRTNMSEDYLKAISYKLDEISKKLGDHYTEETLDFNKKSQFVLNLQNKKTEK